MKTCLFLASLALTAPAFAQMPRMGGEMKHILVHLHGQMLEGHVDTLVATPILRDYGEEYMGAASVLNGTMYNAQYGWMAEGFWTPPQGSFLWIERTSATPGLLAYRGGTMMNPGSYDPIFGTGGSSPRIMWDGTMLHNWYAATAEGRYSATYRIYFGDADGTETPGYEAGEVELTWTTPDPCPADFNGDGFVDFFDYGDYVGCFESGACPPGITADVNADGFTDFFDMTAYVADFEHGC